MVELPEGQDEKPRRHRGGCRRPHRGNGEHGPRDVGELGKLDGCTTEEAGRRSAHRGTGRTEIFHPEGGPQEEHAVQPERIHRFQRQYGSSTPTPASARCCARPTSKASTSARRSTSNCPSRTRKPTWCSCSPASKAWCAKRARIQPALIANYLYDLVKEYNQFYHDFSILREEDEALKRFRLAPVGHRGPRDKDRYRDCSASKCRKGYKQQSTVVGQQSTVSASLLTDDRDH